MEENIVTLEIEREDFLKLKNIFTYVSWGLLILFTLFLILSFSYMKLIFIILLLVSIIAYSTMLFLINSQNKNFENLINHGILKLIFIDYDDISYKLNSNLKEEEFLKYGLFKEHKKIEFKRELSGVKNKRVFTISNLTLTEEFKWNKEKKTQIMFNGQLFILKLNRSIEGIIRIVDKKMYAKKIKYDLKEAESKDFNFTKRYVMSTDSNLNFSKKITSPVRRKMNEICDNYQGEFAFYIENDKLIVANNNEKEYFKFDLNESFVDSADPELNSELEELLSELTELAEEFEI